MNGVVLRGWKVSFYTGKLHSYLCYKRIPFQFKSINAFELNYVIPKKVGAWVMPVLQTAGGQYLQDTHDIIMALEKQCPERPILPSEIDSYDRRILSFLVAAWADEFWIPTAILSVVFP
jgi:glutathione S-transferase